MKQLCFLLFIVFIALCNDSFAQSDKLVNEVYEYYSEKDAYTKEGLLVEFKKLDLNDNAHKISFGKIYELIRKNPDDQTYALILAIDNYENADRANVLRKKFDDLSKLDEALKIALSLENEGLLACIYYIYGLSLDLIKQPEKAIVYFKRAHNILHSGSGNKLFLYESTCFNLAKALYQLFEYRHSLEYSEECLASSKTTGSLFNGISKIYTLDLIGASYKKLGKADSSIIFYNKILQELKIAPLENQYFNELWANISEGNIGENLLNKGQVKEARGFIENYYNFNQVHEDIYNTFLSTNLKARLEF